MALPWPVEGKEAKSVISRWRLLLAVALGGAVFALSARLGAPAPALIGWNAGVLLYLAMVWRLFLTSGEKDIRARAGRQDERRWVILAIILTAIAASVGAIVAALLAVKKTPAQGSSVAALAALTLATTWVLLQSVFTLHYAHEHFRLERETADRQGGFKFPGEPARGYLDFVYLAFCVGATCQVSDPEVTHVRLRNLVTVHGATAFFYNTTVLALGINILAGVFGK